MKFLLIFIIGFLYTFIIIPFAFCIAFTKKITWKDLKFIYIKLFLEDENE